MQMCGSMLLGQWGGVRRGKLRHHYGKHIIIARDGIVCRIFLLGLNSAMT